MQAHPYLKSPSFKELHYYDQKYSQGEVWYRSEFPPTTIDQIAFDRTDNYFTSSNQVNINMHMLTPNEKLIITVCNPVVRAYAEYSDVINGLIQPTWRKKMMLTSSTTFPRFIEKYLAFIKEAVENPEKHKFHTFEDFVEKIDRVLPEASIITNGLYVIHLNRFLKHFDKNQIFVIDAENLKDEPWDVMAGIETFLGIPNMVTKNNFYRNETTQLHCVNNRVSICPKTSDLATKDTVYVSKSREVDELSRFYQPYINLFTSLINQ